ncbi:VWA domain-containing protein [Marinovum sp. 2_MG-2023]|uniref:vWA domain-containing protein n=1 Tax=unclassified Marinovum TaxID=2647166 RepID=UPI0026E386C9|nr:MULTISPECIES: VWA domain-containing protein [unclassified Marinovum]MDO6729341.1 VWA domain-containing protein [Marinovum sp. 2_MG-2023]MDO6780443.1 VWA domain-containing protein [Marinovum sp. 1_MG-2023]
MPEYAPLDLPDTPRLTDNITHFARALRKAGLPIGPGRVIEAIRAVAATGFTDRRDFYWTLHACFVNKPEQRAVFAQVFRLYWRDPQFMEHMMSLLLPSMRGVQEERSAKAAEKRAAEALLDGADLPNPEEDHGSDEDQQIEIDATLTMSATEKLRQLDFEQMSTAEMARAKRMLARLSLPVPPIKSRRSRASHVGHAYDTRKTLRDAMRQGGQITDIALKKPRIRWPNLVVICDISGSMSTYSRTILHFLHAVANEKGAGWARVHAFTFGTRLTNITRLLATRDVDAALAAAGAQAQDWEGGTRIGQCLQDFNRDWSRRVMGQGAVTLLITDGLDRGDLATLDKAMERLHLSSRHLIWINPLLRWDGFAAKAQGIRTMLPHVDTFRAGHSIESLEALADAISRPHDPGEKARLLAEMR